MASENRIDSGQAGIEPELKRRTTEVVRVVVFSYLWNVLYALDVLLNAVAGGDRRDTISSRLGRGKVAKKPVHVVLSWVVDLLFLVVFKEKDHCVNNIIITDDRYAVSSILSRLRKG